MTIPGKVCMAKKKTAVQSRHIANILSNYKVIQVVFAGDHTHPPVFSYIVNFPRITLPLAGSYELEIESNRKADTIALRKGHVVLSPPNCWDKPTWRRPTEVLAFLFGKTQIGISYINTKDESKTGIQANKIAIKRPLMGPAQNILQAILELRERNLSYPGFPPLVQSLLYCCGTIIEEDKQVKVRKASHLFNNICLYLQESFPQDISRDSVAEHFRITPNHLSRLFHREGKMKFNQYLTFVRIDRAKFLLKRYSLTLDEVARRCGYNDTTYFCRTFKRITKKTPTQYRQSHA